MKKTTRTTAKKSKYGNAKHPTGNLADPILKPGTKYRLVITHGSIDRHYLLGDQIEIEALPADATIVVGECYYFRHDGHEQIGKVTSVRGDTIRYRAGWGVRHWITTAKRSELIDVGQIVGHLRPVPHIQVEIAKRAEADFWKHLQPVTAANAA